MLFWIRNNRLISRFLILKLILVFGVFTFFPLEVDAGKRVKVRGYYRKDGTYVSPHYRSAPDGNLYNNYSYPGNYNPNTGKTTTGDPLKYLERYYNRSSSRTASVDFYTWLRNLENPTPNRGRDIHEDPSSHLERIESGFFTIGSTLREVAAIQGAPDWFAETQYDYGDSRVYFENGRVTHWYSTSSNILRTLLVAASADNGFVGVGSTKDEVVAIQGVPDRSTETQFNYGRSSIYFTGDRVTHWYSYVLDPLRVKLAAPPTGKTYFTVGSTQEEVVVIQGTPTSLTETRYDYGRSSIYFAEGRVMRWYSSPLNPLKAELAAPPTDKTHFTVGSTKEEVAAIQGTPASFTKTRYDYGRSSVYFIDDRVTHWNNSPQNPLKVGTLKLASTSAGNWNNSPQNPLKVGTLQVKLASTSAGKTHFTVGSTKEEVTTVQGTPTFFSEGRFSYGASIVYFEDGRVINWYNSPQNPLQAKLVTTPTNKTHFTVGSTIEEIATIQGTPTSFTENYYNYGLSTVYFKNGRVTRWYESASDPLKVK